MQTRDHTHSEWPVNWSLASYDDLSVFFREKVRDRYICHCALTHATLDSFSRRTWPSSCRRS